MVFDVWIKTSHSIDTKNNYYMTWKKYLTSDKWWKEDGKQKQNFSSDPIGIIIVSTSNPRCFSLLHQSLMLETLGLVTGHVKYIIFVSRSSLMFILFPKIIFGRLYQFCGDGFHFRIVTDSTEYRWISKFRESDAICELGASIAILRARTVLTVRTGHHQLDLSLVSHWTIITNKIKTIRVYHCLFGFIHYNLLLCNNISK